MSGKKWGMILGIILLIVGVLGLIGGFGIVGEEGLFMTDRTHDLVHLVTGLIFIIVAAKSGQSMGMVLKVFGVIYVLLGILGFVMESPLLGFLTTNGADNVLHLILGIVFFWAGMMAGKRSSSMPTITAGSPM